MQSEVPIVRWIGDMACASRDTVAVEEPLEIRINGESLTVTMRTPGDDFDLVAGFLFAEGIVHSANDMRFMGYGANPNDPERENIVDVALAADWREVSGAARWERSFAINSSCGVCGKTHIEAVRAVAPPLSDSEFRVSVGVLRGLSERLRAAQHVFEKTGGLHAAGLFDSTGNLLESREDVGRHNAVDKLFGSSLRARQMPLDAHILMVSGRVGFEILQKAAVARVPVLCAVSAPSSLAVELANALNMTLVGFLRGETMNVYAGAERLTI